VGNFDIEDQRGRSQPHRRALADQHPNGGVALMPHRDLRWLHYLRAWINLLVVAGQIHPEQHATKLCVGFALLTLIGPDRLGVPHASPGPERQQRALGQPYPFHGATRAGAVARAD
jgi:hypothetical protein